MPLPETAFAIALQSPAHKNASTERPPGFPLRQQWRNVQCAESAVRMWQSANGSAILQKIHRATFVKTAHAIPAHSPPSAATANVKSESRYSGSAMCCAKTEPEKFTRVPARTHAARNKNRFKTAPRCALRTQSAQGGRGHSVSGR